MKCAACQHENRPGLRFCENCAAPLTQTEPPPPAGVVCGNCAHTNRPGLRFCENCATPLMVEEMIAPVVEELLVCPACRHANRPGLRFCENCAQPLMIEEIVAPPEPEPVAVPPEPTPVMVPSTPPPAVAPPPPAAAPPRPVREVVVMCTHCGHHNPTGQAFCGRCGEPLVRLEPAKKKPPFFTRVLRLALSLVGTLLIGAFSTLVTRYAVPYVVSLVTGPATFDVTEQQAVQLANQFVSYEYSDFSNVQPSIQPARDGIREVYAVAYTKNSNSGTVTLVVLVDAETGEAELMEPNRSRSG